jgi:hypothetical protein
MKMTVMTDVVQQDDTDSEDEEYATPTALPKYDDRGQHFQNIIVFVVQDNSMSFMWSTLLLCRKEQA